MLRGSESHQNELDRNEFAGRRIFRSELPHRVAGITFFRCFGETFRETAPARKKAGIVGAKDFD